MNLTSRSAVEWRYIHGRPVKHALTRADNAAGHAAVALCGTDSGGFFAFAGWLGTGSQGEYERVAQLRECGRCARLLAPAKGGAS